MSNSVSNVMAIMDAPQLLSFLDVHRALVFLAGAVVVRVLWRKYCTSIRDIPGPFWASFSSIWKVYQVWKGHSELEILELHKKHGMSLLSFDLKACSYSRPFCSPYRQ
jgi:hypothetical protein